MPIPIEFADGPGGTAIDDYNRCIGAANDAQKAKLRRLLYGYVHDTLRDTTPEKLERYLGSRQQWQVEDGHVVFRTHDQPSVAFCAVERDDGVAVIVLGFALDFPGFPDRWWTDVVRPRLLRHI